VTPLAPAAGATFPLPPTNDLAALARYADLVIRAAGYTNAAIRQCIAAIGIAESRMGVWPGWILPSGAPSYNVGALVGTGTAGSIEHADHDKNGKPVVYRFKAFHTATEGVDAFVETWTKIKSDPAHAAAINEAARAGDTRRVAALMFSKGYFTGTSGTPDERIDRYASMVYASAKQFAAAIGEPLALHKPGAPACPAGHFYDAASGQCVEDLSVSPAAPASGGTSVAPMAVAVAVGLGLALVRKG
jgi:hypothetical protein